jgi:pimeloyl-ACP methyl ester carboxylesterase
MRPTPTAPDELRALNRLAFEELGNTTRGISRTHRAVADRVFRATGVMARPVHVIHHAVSHGIYAALGAGTSSLGHAADAAIATRRRAPGRPLSTTSSGSALLAILNGLIGDRLEEEQNPLHQPMSVRVGGEIVPAERQALAEAFPDASSRVVVFLHGLMETENAWRLGAGPHGDTYGTRLARDFGATPVYLRYNSGRHVSENGRSLADLLAEVVEAWPVGVTELALVGHSMGGLVARSACHQASGEGAAWVRRVRHVVSLGTPHMGAPLEEIVHLSAAGLASFPETGAFAAFLRRRSAGIRDLRRGSLVDEDWRDRDVDALRAAACQEVPLLEGATHCFVAATVTRSPKHPMGRLIGDWLVLEPSASGRSRSRRIPFRSEHGMHLGGANHFALLNHPRVYEKLREWLATPPEPAAALPPGR